MNLKCLIKRFHLFCFQMSQTLDRSLMLLIYVDALTTIVGGSILTSTVALRSVGVAHATLCDVFFLSLHTPLFIGVVATALVAVIRFTSIQR